MLELPGTLSVMDDRILSVLHDVIRSGATQRTDPISQGLHPADPITLNLVVAGRRQSVAIDPHELMRGYVPLLRILLEERQGKKRRILAGIAGVPGSGKSTLVSILAALWRAAAPGPTLATVAMDGWHLRNAELDRREFANPDGSRIPLRRRKGSPPSFDVEAFADALERIRTSEGDVRVPVYDRARHEPVPNAELVPSTVDIVLVEGNYVLLREGPWRRVGESFDVSFWIDIDPEACAGDIIARHMSGGMTPEGAKAKYAENDKPNAAVALATRGRADWLIDVTRGRRVRAITPGPSA